MSEVPKAVSEVPPGFVKIRLSGPDGQIETPWAQRVGDCFRIDNLPWLAYGISDDDIVEGAPTDAEGLFEFVRVRTPSGNRLIRLIFDESVASQPVLDDLVTMGCHYEGYNQRYVAVSIPPNVDLGMVVAYVEERVPRWEYANPPYEQLHPE
jgi:hypothetical protein